jgi:ATP-binding cassette subfamily B protein
MAHCGSSKKRLATRVLAQIKGQWRLLSLVFLLEMLSTPLSLLAPIGIKIAIDNVIGGKPLPHFVSAAIPAVFLRPSSHLLIFAIALQISVALLIQLHWCSNYLLKIQSGERMLLNFRARLFGHLQHLPLDHHDQQGSADSVFRVQNDAAALKGITIDGALFLISDVVKLIGMTAATLLIDWRLGIVALSVAPLLGIQGLIYERRVGGRYKEVKELESSAFRAVHEALSTIRVVKAFVQEDAENRRFVRRSTDASDARIRLGQADGIFGLAVNLTTAIGMAIVLYVGVRNVQTGTVTLGSLLLIITYLVQLYAPLQNITYHFASLKAASASVERALDVFDKTPESSPRSPLVQHRTVRAFGSVEFRNVTFAYPGKKPILENFSFEIPPAARIGLLGKTGSGKTTFLNLLVRFVSPQSGRILLDGRDLQDIDLGELRKQFAFVLQESVLFSTSIAENIAYGNPEASEAEIIRAARQACAHEFIQRLPERYKTEVGDRGVLLSGGERQRISIARAFLVDAPILILDEPTSSIDIATEAEVLAATQRLSAGRTCFFVSHRLKTLVNCDLLLKFAHGLPVEILAGDPDADIDSLITDLPFEPAART